LKGSCPRCFCCPRTQITTLCALSQLLLFPRDGGPLRPPDDMNDGVPLRIYMHATTMTNILYKKKAGRQAGVLPSSHYHGHCNGATSAAYSHVGLQVARPSEEAAAGTPMGETFLALLARISHSDLDRWERWRLGGAGRIGWGSCRGPAVLGTAAHPELPDSFFDLCRLFFFLFLFFLFFLF